MPKDNVNWEPDVRKALDKLNSTGGRLQEDVDRIARETRENAVSPLDVVSGGLPPPPGAIG